MIEIKGKHEKQKSQEKVNKKIEKKNKRRLLLKLLICIVVVYVILMEVYLIMQKVKNNTKNLITETKLYYEIENIGNVKFKNASITIKDKMSYISIDIVNGENKKLTEQEIYILIKKENKEVEYIYKIPNIEQGETYTINLMSTGDLTNAEEIKVEGIDL